MRDALKNARSVVVKIGTSSLLNEAGELDLPVIKLHLLELVSLHQKGVRVVLVTSGSIGAGRGKLGYDKRPDTIPELQASAAVGQSLLMNSYNSLLAPEGYFVAQLLLTHEDFRDRKRYLNVRNTLAALHGKPVLPVINENDTVATEEIHFGDNDGLAAQVAGLVDADVTILFSDVDGFHFEGEKLDQVQEITAEMEKAAGPGDGTGGMVTKLRAAGTITRAGGHVVIAKGKDDSVGKILEGNRVGTLFEARSDLDSRARWVHGLVEAGKVHVDAGGEAAIRTAGKSLLPVGITSCEGAFQAGDVVVVVGPGGSIAKGLVNYGAGDLEKIQGKKSAQIEAALGSRPFDEAIHRDNMVLL